MCDESGDFIPQWLRWYESHFLNYPFIDMEIEVQFGVIFLNNDLSRLFDGFGTYTTHIGVKMYQVKEFDSLFNRSFKGKGSYIVYVSYFLERAIMLCEILKLPSKQNLILCCLLHFDIDLAFRVKTNIRHKIEIEHNK